MRKDRFEIFSASVMRLVRSVQALKARKMAEYDLKGTNAICLCRVLESEDGLTTTELATVCEIDKAQISRCMAELTEKGFVVREMGEVRRYKQKYLLTPAGRHAALDISHTFFEIEETVSKNIPTAALDHFYHTLYKLCDNFDALLFKYQTEE